MQKKDIYNLNLKVTITFTIVLIFLLFSWSCGKKSEPIRPNSELSSKEKIVNE